MHIFYNKIYIYIYIYYIVKKYVFWGEILTTAHIRCRYPQFLFILLAADLCPSPRHGALHHGRPPGPDGAQERVLLPQQPRTLQRRQHRRVVDRTRRGHAHAAALPAQAAQGDR